MTDDIDKKIETGKKSEVLAPPFDDYTDMLLKSVPELRMGWMEEVMGTAAE